MASLAGRAAEAAPRCAIRGTALGALANQYTIWHAHRLRHAAAARGEIIGMTRLERRRTQMVLVLAVLTFLVVAFELYAHEFITHHPWPQRGATDRDEGLHAGDQVHHL